jgi:hypothetical protein
VRGRSDSGEAQLVLSKAKRKSSAETFGEDHGWSKINVDPSFVKDTESGSWGAIARTDAGSVVFSA